MESRTDQTILNRVITIFKREGVFNMNIKISRLNHFSKE